MMPVKSGERTTQRKGRPRGPPRSQVPRPQLHSCSHYSRARRADSNRAKSADTSRIVGHACRDASEMCGGGWGEQAACVGPKEALASL